MKRIGLMVCIVCMLLQCSCGSMPGQKDDQNGKCTLYRWDSSQANPVAFSGEEILTIREMNPVNRFYQQVICLSEGKEPRPVCSIAGCKHDSTACNACFHEIADVFVIGETLYVVADRYDMGGPGLYRMKIDGSGRKEILRLQENDSDGSRFAIAMLGYTEDTLYYSVPYASKESYEKQQPKEKIYSVKLEENALPKEISLAGLYHANDTCGLIQSAECDGEALYVTMELGDQTSRRTCAAEISEKDGSVRILFESDAESCYLCKKGDIYISCDNNLYSVDLKTSKIKQISSDCETGVLLAGKDCLYVCPEKMGWSELQANTECFIRFVDLDGNIKEEWKALYEMPKVSSFELKGIANGSIFAIQDGTLFRFDVNGDKRWKGIPLD